MEIRPTKANLTMLSQARDGNWVQVEDDVQNVVNDLHKIDPHLRVRYSEAGEYFVVYWKPENEPEGNGELVTTAVELDQRVVKLVQEGYWKAQQPGYSFADELDRIDKENEAKKDREFTEKHGEIYERLAHAIRDDLGLNQNKIYVPGGNAASA